MSMADNDPTQIFAAIKYKAFDYDFEMTTSLKVIMDWLALPTLYDICSDVYPHTGKLIEDAYRRPWIRGRDISTCKPHGCVLEDLEKEHPFHLFLERLRADISQVKGHPVDVVPSSNPDSLADLDMDEVTFLLQESNSNLLCQEYFSKSTTDLMYPTNYVKDILLEEPMSVDPLPLLKRHLPTLTAKLSRLRSLPVTDPLLSTTGNGLSEESILRHCAPYKIPPNEDTKGFTISSHIYEEFNKESAIKHESLLLPVGLETSLGREKCSHVQSIQNVLNVAPEQLEDHISMFDVLCKANQKAPQLSVEVTQFYLSEEMAALIKMDVGQLDITSAGRLVLSTELELDLTLTPPNKTKSTQLWRSNSQLTMEELSPVYRQSLVSERDQEQMELALWEAEKHHNSVLGFLLTEPQTDAAAVEFHPLSEALKVLQLGEDRLFSVHVGSVGNELQSQMPSGEPEPYFICLREFTENMTYEFPPTRNDNRMEDFTALSLENNILTVCDKDCVPEVSVNGVKSTLKKPLNPAAADPPEVPVNVDESLCAVAHQREAVGQIHQSSVAKKNENPKDESSGFSVASVSNITAKHKTRESFSVCAATSPDLRETFSNVTRPAKNDGSQPEWRVSSSPTFAKSARLARRDNNSSLPAVKEQPEKGLDSLSTFMILRSQQTAADPALPQQCPASTGPKFKQPTPQPKWQNTPGPQSSPTKVAPPYPTTGVVTGSSARVQKKALQSISQTLRDQPAPQDNQGSKVLQVKATESLCHAYRELLAFAQPCLSRARELGLSCPSWGDFSSIIPDQTRFLLKQQEKELCGMQGEGEELLYNQVALVHVLVTFQDMMFTCDLDTAVEYLGQAAVPLAGHCLEQLVKRLQVLVYLSHRNQEANPKMLELQEQLASWLHSRGGQNSSHKVLILTTVDSDGTRSMLIKALTEVTGEAVTAVCPEHGKNKLNGAVVLSCVRGVLCTVACGQHIGTDFPWHCFSLVVEYDHSGHSPWARLCREKDISHLTFHTSLPDLGVPTASWRLEENVPFVLLVTEGLLNRPLLLQILESTYNVTLLERSYAPSLQMLGGTHQYAVVTVDESTAVVVQELEEMSQDGSCERIVMRLTALSLQYSRCWLILLCPDSQGGGLSSKAFGNLVLVYSSLVLFGMKPEDLHVKVLIVSEEADVARWISQICFHSLITSDRETSSYLDLHWLAVIPSEEERCLLLFPCVNPLVSQLMLRRAPSLKWLLEASLSELNELLPEVPHKVLKLFSDTTNIYKPSTEPSSPGILGPITQATVSPLSSPWSTSACESEPLSNHQSESTSPNLTIDFGSPMDQSIGTSYCGPEARVATKDMKADFRADQSVSFDWSTSHFHGSGLTNEEPWRHEEEEEQMEEEEAVKLPEGRAEEWIQRVLCHSQSRTYHPHDAASDPFQRTDFSYDTNDRRQEAARPTGGHRLFFSDQKRQEGSYCKPGVRSPVEVSSWGSGSGSNSGSSSLGARETPGMSPRYGYKCWMGLERKRSGEAAGMLGTGEAVLPPLKRGRLSYEKLPGRSDGQTRLKFL